MASRAPASRVGRAFLPPLAADRQRPGLAVEVRQLEGDRLRAPQPGEKLKRNGKAARGKAK